MCAHRSPNQWKFMSNSEIRGPARQFRSKGLTHRISGMLTSSKYIYCIFAANILHIQGSKKLRYGTLYTLYTLYKTHICCIYTIDILVVHWSAISGQWLDSEGNDDCDCRKRRLQPSSDWPLIPPTDWPTDGRVKRQLQSAPRATCPRAPSPLPPL